MGNREEGRMNRALLERLYSDVWAYVTPEGYHIDVLEENMVCNGWKRGPDGREWLSIDVHIGSGLGCDTLLGIDALALVPWSDVIANRLKRF